MPKNNYIEIYPTYNEGKFAIAERFIRTIENKIYKYMTSLSENVCIDKLDYTVHKYNRRYLSTINMKTVNVMSSTYIY